MTTKRLDDETLLSTRQLSEILNVDERSLERWRQTGSGPGFIKVGRLVRYSRVDVEQWLSEHVAGSTAEHANTEANVFVRN